MTGKNPEGSPIYQNQLNQRTSTAQVEGLGRGRVCYPSAVQENRLGGLRWRWLRSSARHRLVWKSGLVVAAERSGSSLLKAWAKRERDIYVYATLRCLQELRDA